MRQLAQGMSFGATAIGFSKRTSFQSSRLLPNTKPDLRARLIMAALERSLSPDQLVGLGAKVSSDAVPLGRALRPSPTRRGRRAVGAARRIISPDFRAAVQ